MTMRQFILMICMMAATAVHAQVKYCNSFYDYKNNQWHELNADVQMERNSKAKTYWWGSSEIKFVSSDKQAEKLLKKEAFAVMFEDSIYVNCKMIMCGGYKFGHGFTKALPFYNDNLMIVYLPVEEAGFTSSMTVMFGLIGGLAAAAASSKSMLENLACYLVNTNSTEKKIKVKRMDTDLVGKLLQEDPELLGEYMSVKKKKVHEGAANTVDIFLRKGWIRQ